MTFMPKVTVYYISLCRLFEIWNIDAARAPSFLFLQSDLLGPSFAFPFAIYTVGIRQADTERWNDFQMATGDLKKKRTFPKCTDMRISREDSPIPTKKKRKIQQVNLLFLLSFFIFYMTIDFLVFAKSRQWPLSFTSLSSSTTTRFFQEKSRCINVCNVTDSAGERELDNKSKPVKGKRKNTRWKIHQENARQVSRRRRHWRQPVELTSISR